MDLGSDVTSIHLEGDTLYAFLGREGLSIIDVTNPFSPKIIGRWKEPIPAEPALWIGSIAISGRCACLSGGRFGIVVLDISDLSNPQKVGGYDSDGSAGGVSVAGSYAYFGDDTKGLKILDISDPKAPKLAASFPMDGYASAVTIAGNRCFVANSYLGLQIIDISDPLRPRKLDPIPITEHVERCTVVGSTLYVSALRGGVHIYHLPEPRPIFRPLLKLTLSGQSLALEWEGEVGRSYVLESTDKIDNPSTWKALLTEPLNKNPVKVFFSAPGKGKSRFFRVRQAED